jgi:hypothetical protein
MLMGLDDTNQKSNETYKKNIRTAMNGRLLATILAIELKGTASIKLTLPNIKPLEIKLLLEKILSEEDVPTKFDSLRC